MKDAKGHGSDSRGGEARGLKQAAERYAVAHQAGVNLAAPSQTGRDLYAAAVAEAQRQEGSHHFSGYDAQTLRDLEPDFDEMPGGPDPWTARDAQPKPRK